MFLKNALNELIMIGGKGATASQLLTLFQDDALCSLFHQCIKTPCSRWEVTLDRKTEMCFVRPGSVLGEFIRLFRIEIKEGKSIWQGRSFRKPFRYVFVF